MTGYFKNEVATKEAFTEDGWLKTGDVGRIDRDGHLFILERLKDVIISGGANIYASELEDVIAGIPGVMESAVVGVPHEKWGETPRAFLVLKAGASLTEEAVIEWMRSRLAHYKCPTSVVFVESLPRTVTGKIDKKAVRAELVGLAS